MHRNNVLYIIIIALCAILLGLVFGKRYGTNTNIPDNNTIVRVHYDTIYNTIFKVVEKPIFKAVETIKYDTVYRDKDTIISLPVERKTYNDTVFFTQNDTVCIETTIIGINPSLERIKALLLKRQINQTTEKIITKYKAKKGFYIAPAITAGYSPIYKNVDVVVGISVGYKF